MNGYLKASKKRHEVTLLPHVNPSDGVKRDVWNEYHLNRFWESYIGNGEDSCPLCRSSSYVEHEKELDISGIDHNTVLVYYKCTTCGQKWRNERPMRHKYEP
jgi:hypothetical protein